MKTKTIIATALLFAASTALATDSRMTSKSDNQQNMHQKRMQLIEAEINSLSIIETDPANPRDPETGHPQDPEPNHGKCHVMDDGYCMFW